MKKQIMQREKIYRLRRGKSREKGEPNPLPSPFSLSLYAPLILLLVLWSSSPESAHAQSDYGFQFVRIQYGESGGGRGGGFGRGGGAPWRHDWPTAEENFYIALERTTQIHIDGPPLVLTLDDKRIFDYPVLYLCEPGYWDMDDEQVENLREYLSRGGFILFDDFRGQWEWMNLYDQMKRVFPDAEPEEIDPDHPIWSIYYEVDPIAAPSLVSGGGGRTDVDQYIAFFDEKGRMVALANYNQDLGDGWEWPDFGLEGASLISFQMGVNFLMYALTH